MLKKKDDKIVRNGAIKGAKATADRKAKALSH